MKRNPPGVAVASTCFSAAWFLAIFCASFFSIISASAARPQTGGEELNAAEQWVVAQLAAGEVADLSTHEERGRKLSARFLRELLLGALPGFKPHRNGVRIIGAIIDEPIDVTNAQILGDVWLKRCHFNKDVTFTRAKVEGDAVFDDAIFEGPATFERADIAGNFNAIRGTFQNRQTWANFQTLKVGADTVFDEACFESYATFARADIGGRFSAGKAKFLNPMGANFFSMKVGGDALFVRTLFEGQAEFGRVGRANFQSMKVRGEAVFQGALFQAPVNFSYADLGWLDLSRASWPKLAAQVDMQGMNYNYIGINDPNSPNSRKALLELAEHWRYTPDVYSNLEAFFLRQGNRADADKAFIAGKRRERQEYLRGHDWFGWLGSWALDLLVGYGRRPWQAAIPCAFFVALGCFLFSPRKMEAQKPEDTPRVYSRFWYSLGLFLPFVNLQADQVWKPKADQTFLRNYMRVHILLGWILVPLVLAALTGLIK